MLKNYFQPWVVTGLAVPKWHDAAYWPRNCTSTRRQ